MTLHERICIELRAYQEVSPADVQCAVRGVGMPGTSTFKIGSDTYAEVRAKQETIILKESVNCAEDLNKILSYCENRLGQEKSDLRMLERGMALTHYRFQQRVDAYEATEEERLQWHKARSIPLSEYGLVDQESLKIFRERKAEKVSAAAAKVAAKDAAKQAAAEAVAATAAEAQAQPKKKQRRKKKSSDAPFSSTLLQYLQCSDIDETETLKDLSDRQLVCAKIVHFIIWSLDLMVYGGFVRDAVIRSEPCNDIDVRVDSVGNVQSAESVAERIADFATTYLELEQTMQLTQKGKAKTIEFNSDGWDKPLQIDLVMSAISVSDLEDTSV